MVLTLSFDTRPSSMPLKCTYEVDERRAVSVPPLEVNHVYTVSSHPPRLHPTPKADWPPGLVATEFFCILPTT